MPESIFGKQFSGQNVTCTWKQSLDHLLGVINCSPSPPASLEMWLAQVLAMDVFLLGKWGQFISHNSGISGNCPPLVMSFAPAPPGKCLDGLWNVSSPTSDGTCALGSECAESLLLGPPGKCCPSFYMADSLKSESLLKSCFSLSPCQECLKAHPGGGEIVDCVLSVYTKNKHRCICRALLNHCLSSCREYLYFFSTVYISVF